MGKFGTSESMVFTTTGQLTIIEDTDEVCTTCDGSAAGPQTFGIIRQSSSSVTLICPNCGDTKTVFPGEVQRKLSPEEIARRMAQIQAATAKPAPAPAPAAPFSVVRKQSKKPPKPVRPAKKLPKKKAAKAAKKAKKK